MRRLFGNALDIGFVSVVEDLLGLLGEAAIVSLANDRSSTGVKIDGPTTVVLSIAILQSSKDGVDDVETSREDGQLGRGSQRRKKNWEAHSSASAAFKTKSALLASSLMRSRSLNEPRTMRAPPKALETASSSFSERTRAEIYLGWR